MKCRITVSCFVLAVAMILPALASAATWSLVGQSGFTVTNNPSANGALNDPNRIRLHSIVVDAEGDVYATAGNNANDDSPTSSPSGVTVFPAGGGSPVDLNLIPTARNIPGGITKLVVAGDGRVYALQGYYEINWTWTSTTWKHKILRFRRDPNNAGAYLVDVIFDMNTERAYLGYTLTEQSPDKDIIGGMTVGPDGNVYWTCGQQLSNIWKFRYLYGYNVYQNAIQRSPLNCGPVGQACSLPAQGSTSERMFNLEAVGSDTTLTAPNQNWFAVIWHASVGGAGNNWGLDAMTWDLPRQGAITNGSTSGLGVWWRDLVTATAYDPVRKKLWVAGRSRTPNAGSNASGRAWESNGSDKNVMNPVLDGSATVLKVVQTNATKRNWQRALPADYSTVTLGARFRVQAYSADYSSSIMHAAARTPNTTPASPLVVLAIRNNRFVLLDSVNAWAQLADLGAVDTNQYYEVHMSCNASGSGTVKVWLDGQLTTVTGTLRETSAMTDGVGFGAAAPKSQSVVGTATILFDWVGLSNTEVAGQAKPEPTNIWPSGPLPTGILAGFLDGSVLPQEFNSSNVIIRFNGAGTDGALFKNGSLNTSLSPVSGWATNGNNPGLLDGGTKVGGEGLPGIPASNISNGGSYWVSALAINPCDGSAWMSWAGAESYETSTANLPAGDTTPRLVTKYSYNGTYGPTGKVYTVGANGTIYDAGGDQGAPLAPWSSQVVGLTFKGKKVYALVVDMSTNPATFKVFSTDNPASCCNEVPYDADADHDVDMADYGVLQACLYNTTAYQYNKPECRCFDQYPGGTMNGTVDSNDVGEFNACYSGPAMPQTSAACK